MYSENARSFDAFRISLFDAYITSDDKEDYTSGPLLNFRKFFGPERRDILMMFRSSCNPNFIGEIAREPQIDLHARISTMFYCQHYGKSISISQWEETCDYYAKYFPYESYGKKWENRKGKAIHIISDFETSLFEWNEELFNNAIKIH